MKSYILMILSISVLSGCYTQFALTKHETWHDHEEYVEEYYEDDTVAVADEEGTEVYVRHIYVRPHHGYHVVHYDPYWDSWDDCWDCWDYDHVNIYVSTGYRHWGYWDYPWGYPYHTYRGHWGGYWGGHWSNYWHGGYDPYSYYGYGYGYGYGYDRHYNHANFKKRSFSKRLPGRSSHIVRNPRRAGDLHTVQGVPDAKPVRPVRTVSAGGDVKNSPERSSRIVKNGDHVISNGTGHVNAERSPKRTKDLNNDGKIRRDRNIVSVEEKKATKQKTANERKYYNTPVPQDNKSSNGKRNVRNDTRKKSNVKQVTDRTKKNTRIKSRSKSTRIRTKSKSPTNVKPMRAKSKPRSSVSKPSSKSSSVKKSSSGSKSKSVKRSGSRSKSSSGRVSKPSRSSGSSGSSGRVSSGSRSSGSRSSGSVSRGSSGSRSSGSRSSGSRSSGGRSRGRR